MILPDALKHTESHVVLDLADTIRRDGSRLYGAAPNMPNCAYQSSLCGLTASYNRNGDVIALKGAGLHVMVALSHQPVDDSDGIDRNSDSITTVATLYHAGDVASLDAWHRHLCAYRRSMRTGNQAAAA